MPSYGPSDFTARNPSLRSARVSATRTCRQRSPTATRVARNAAKGALAAVVGGSRNAPALAPSLVSRKKRYSSPASAAHATTAAIVMRARTTRTLLRELGFGGRAAVHTERVGHLIGHVVRLRARRIRTGAHVRAEA